MDFLQKLDFMMKKDSLNKRTLSQNSGIPYTTIDGWYKKGYEGMKLSTLRILASYFNTVLDFWVQDDITDSNYRKSSFSENNSPDTAMDRLGDKLCSILVYNFDQLNREGQERLMEISDDMVSSGKYIKNDSHQLDSTQGS